MSNTKDKTYVIKKLYDFIKQGNVSILTGAGISTHSHIPDYRSPNGSYSKGHVPMEHNDFINYHNKRQKYWARSIIGSKIFELAQYNIAHKRIYQLYQQGLINKIITQNVDSLHRKVSPKNIKYINDIIELHGNNRIVKCLTCNSNELRINFQNRIIDNNIKWIKKYLKLDQYEIKNITLNKLLSLNQLNPDGDANIEVKDDQNIYQNFIIPNCLHCKHGIIKPDVIFFGGNMLSNIRDQSIDAINTCDRLLIIGTSVQVYSAYRLALLAKKQKKNIYILNLGNTRADHIANYKIQDDIVDILDKLYKKYFY